MLLLYGDVMVTPEWQIMQQEAAGYCRAYWVHGGDAYYDDEAGRAAFCENQIYLLPSAAPYFADSNPNNPLCCTFLHLDPSPYLIRKLVVLEYEAYPVVASLFAAAREAITAQRQPLLQALANLLEKELQELGMMELASPAIRDSILYIQAHLAEPLKLTDLASLSGYQPQYFIRLFKKYMGISPGRYIRQSRLKYAASLLRSGAGLGQIAEKTGYADAKTFSAAFKSYYRFAPSHYGAAEQAQP